MHFFMSLVIIKSSLLLIPKSITAMGGLRTLNLSGNAISFVPPGTFSTNLFIERIDLSYNELEYLQKGTFQGPKGCLSISLRKNYITKIDMATFDGVQICEINLYRNHLYAIDIWPLAQLMIHDHFVRIDLAFNKIIVATNSRNVAKEREKHQVYVNVVMLTNRKDMLNEDNGVWFCYSTDNDHQAPRSSVADINLTNLHCPQPEEPDIFFFIDDPRVIWGLVLAASIRSYILWARAVEFSKHDDRAWVDGVINYR
jgi:hypothetical protein